jgi:hypothetical protein
MTPAEYVDSVHRRPALLALTLAAALAAGCGGSSGGPSTAPLTTGAEIGAHEYLADTDAAAAAARAFVATLERAGPRLSPAALRLAAPDLRRSYLRMRALAGRLSAGRLADTRLESQRERAAPLVAAVVTRMGQVVDAAEHGDPRAAAAAARALGASLDALRQG